MEDSFHFLLKNEDGESPFKWINGRYNKKKKHMRAQDGVISIVEWKERLLIWYKLNQAVTQCCLKRLTEERAD